MALRDSVKHNGPVPLDNIYISPTCGILVDSTDFPFRSGTTGTSSLTTSTGTPSSPQPSHGSGPSVISRLATSIGEKDVFPVVFLAFSSVILTLIVAIFIILYGLNGDVKTLK